MPRLTQVAHAQLAAHIQAGDCVIDATAGNGHDTLFLARCVGPHGEVFAIDRQASALTKTRERLIAESLEAQVALIEGDHANILTHVRKDLLGRVTAIAFNLGYLPGSDKEVITTADSTRQALDASLQLLASGGLLSVLVYRGHDGGHAEESMILNWLQTNQTRFSSTEWNDGDFPTNASPRLLSAIKA